MLTSLLHLLQKLRKSGVTTPIPHTPPLIILSFCFFLFRFLPQCGSTSLQLMSNPSAFHLASFNLLDIASPPFWKRHYTISSVLPPCTIPFRIDPNLLFYSFFIQTTGRKIIKTTPHPPSCCPRYCCIWRRFFYLEFVVILLTVFVYVLCVMWWMNMSDNFILSVII